MTGLIDCNNFFVSCERIFNPRLRNIPVAVLSNNDGCIVALSNECKALGLRRGDPYFKIKPLCDRHGVAVLSGNHRLYGDISGRVMATVAAVIGNVQVYSVDECFIDFDLRNPQECVDVAHTIVHRVRRNVGIPTSLGIAPSKTLAKIASHFAKKYPAYRGVCVIDNDERRRKALSLTPIRDVWGFGRRLTQRLNNYALTTALQFADMPEQDVRAILPLPGVRTWKELNGTPCIDIDTIEHGDNTPLQKQMCCSRSFAKDITDFDTLSEAISLFATNISRRLRSHKALAKGVTVFICTNGFRTDLPQYYNSAYAPLPDPANDIFAIAEAAQRALSAVFRKGFGYKRAGIFVDHLYAQAHTPPSLFADTEADNRKARLMQVLDHINEASISHDRVHLASYMPVETYTNCNQRSKLYSTRLSDIINVKTPPTNGI